ncbi:hypothetical protein [Ktedonobacter racemifer]|uniref:Uncharacterized protein n=1 Tax=Ktedonobacter racemifer DSM 44963 TaxID=485913 RepID=D6TWT1_KTERA|nr:hypothetical protein [Ktedonobacter racemifer]EFH84664.1 hypothetical protein Krac_5760 [Ktedonobacter racemifer DSM 44963]
MSNWANEPRKAAFNETEISHSEVHVASFNTLCRSDIPLIIKMAGEPTIMVVTTPHGSSWGLLRRLALPDGSVRAKAV